MTLREEITKSRNEMYDGVGKASTAEDIELIIERIDDLTELLHSIDVKLFNISVNQPPVSLTSAIPNDVLSDAIELFKEVVAEKKRELAEKSSKEE